MVHVIELVSPATVEPGTTIREAEAALLWDDVCKVSFYVLVFHGTGRAIVDYSHKRYYVRGVTSIAVFASTMNQKPIPVGRYPAEGDSWPLRLAGVTL